MMSCRDVGEHLGVFLRGELPFTERFEFHRHLAGCVACHDAVERARDAMDLSRSACSGAADPVPDEVPDLLVAAIRSFRRDAN
jgi:anti-sigma factor RsiW